MKKLLFMFLPLVIFLGCNCTKQVDQKKEKQTDKKNQINQFEQKEKDPIEKKSLKEEFSGYWKAYDKENKIFYIHLKEDGSASSSWCCGEKGTWKIVAERVQILWSDGWKAWIYKEGNEFKKMAYEPKRPLYYKATEVHEIFPIKESQIPKKHMNLLKK